jgi:Protein of unknown function (DUF2510)
MLPNVSRSSDWGELHASIGVASFTALPLYVFDVSTGDVGPPPGWFPDPVREADLRWWDGVGWTAHIFPPAAEGTGRHEQAPGQTGLRGLKIVAWLTLLAIPVDLLILHWVNAVAINKQNCYASYPSFPSHVGLLAPTGFGLASLFCLVFGWKAVARGRQQWNQRLENDGRAVVVLSILGVTIAIGSIVIAWLIEAASYMCLF